MVSKRLLISAMALSISTLSVPAFAVAYGDEMDMIDAQIALINKRNELQTALKAASSTLTLPLVTSVIQDRKGDAAKVVYASGLVRWVKVGDDLGEGVKVKRIDSAGVAVGVGKRDVSLGFFTEKAENQTITLSPNAPRIDTPPLPNPSSIVVPVTAPANTQPTP